jgi:hypothetical protein
VGSAAIDGQYDPFGQTILAEVPPPQKNPASQAVHLPSVVMEGMVDR